MTPHELTTLLAEKTTRQFDEPYKLMLLDRALVWYDRLVRNTLDKDPRRRKEFIQSVTITVKSSCKELSESLDEVPICLFVNGINFDYVGSVSGLIPYIYTSSPSNVALFSHNKYNNNGKYYSYINNKIQVYNSPNQKVVRIDGIFTNPKVIAKTSGLNPYEFMNTDMRIPMDIMQLIILSMEQNDLRGELMDNNKDEIKVKNED